MKPKPGDRLYVQKCDAPRCGSLAEVSNKFGGRFCRGHAYLAHRDKSDKAVCVFVPGGERR